MSRKCQPESRTWSFNSLYADCIWALNADARLDGKGYPEGCSALQAAAIDLVRGARFKAERVAEWNRKQAAKSES